jgi:hypothetical protein
MYLSWTMLTGVTNMTDNHYQISVTMHVQLDLHREVQKVYLLALLLTWVPVDCVPNNAFTYRYDAGPEFHFAIKERCPLQPPHKAHSSSVNKTN